LVKQHRSGSHDLSLQIWAMLTLEIWMQTFMEAR
jgi:hypothetical protein